MKNFKSKLITFKNVSNLLSLMNSRDFIHSYDEKDDKIYILNVNKIKNNMFDVENTTYENGEVVFYECGIKTMESLVQYIIKSMNENNKTITYYSGNCGDM